MGIYLNPGDGLFKIALNSQIFVDKSNLIEVTNRCVGTMQRFVCVSRPRRFGKSMAADMLAAYYGREEDSTELFQNLKIAESESYYQHKNKYDVIKINMQEFLSETSSVEEMINLLRRYLIFDLEEAFGEVRFRDKENLIQVMKDIYASTKRSFVILIDEWDCLFREYQNDKDAQKRYLDFLRAWLKDKEYVALAYMTGILPIKKYGSHSALNMFSEYSMTNPREMAQLFGFTEEEVFKSLDQFGMSDKKQIVKQWYDGFSFGPFKDIYNPWSITNYLKEKKLRPYWASTSSNGLISKLLQSASANMKTQLEELLNGKQIIVNFDEQIIFGQLEQDENAVWSLLVASGYLKVEEIEYKGMTLEPWYHLAITNLETISMFSNMFKGWFATASANYNEFIKAMLGGNVKAMNLYMNDIALATFSSFDVGKHFSQRSQPERFYHGFVLGLLVEVRDLYEIRSNRESGYGRYDVMLIPKTKENDGIILEFKVKESEEKTLEETVQTALAQIEAKKYDTELLQLGVSKEHIRHYGFAFEGKKVLIG